MVLRSLVVLLSAIVVGTSPHWLNVIASLWGGPVDSQALPFSPYWIAIPGGVAIGISWVFEMGSNQSIGLATESAAGGFNLSRSRGEDGGRRVADRESSLADLPKSQGSVWLGLEADFKEILQADGDLDVVWERTSSYSDAAETWTVAGTYEDVRIAERFYELAEGAGRMLVEWSGYKPPLSLATSRKASARDRWFCAIRDREIRTETYAPGQVMQAGVVTGHVHGGAIHDAIEASIEMCGQVALEEGLEA